MTTPAPSNPKKKRTKKPRRWLRAEYLLCIVSLCIVLCMTAWAAKGVFSVAIAAERAQAQKESEKEKYVTYIYNAFDEKQEDEESADSSAPAEDSLPVELPQKVEEEKNTVDYNAVDLEQFADDDGYAGALYAMQEEYPKAADILRRYESAEITVDGVTQTMDSVMENAIPERLLQMAADYPQTMDYVLNYPSKIDVTFSIDLSDEVDFSSVPELLQWDERWGYKDYGDGLLGYTGCGPTCLSMVSMYLNQDASITPDVVAKYSDENGYYSYGSGSKWTLMTQAARHFNLDYHEVTVTEWRLKNELDEGRPVICSVREGDFTRGGHFIILTAHDGSDFTVNDPNSLENSQQIWSYSTLSSQIRAAWSYTLRE